jgi:hypothetical protein
VVLVVQLDRGVVLFTNGDRAHGGLLSRGADEAIVVAGPDPA